MEQETWKRQAGSSDRAEVTFRSGCRCRGQVQCAQCSVLSAKCYYGLEGGGGRPCMLLEYGVSSRFAGPVWVKSGSLSRLERKGERATRAARQRGCTLE